MNDQLVDLFDLLYKHYEKARAGEKISIGSVEFDIPADKPAYDDSMGAAESFIKFSRDYLKKNPIVSSGSGMGAFGVTLADKTSLLFCKSTLPEGRESAVVVHMGGRIHPTDALPAADSVAIETGS